GQDQVKEILGKAIENDTVSHAYIFSGSRGTGKTTTARILAKMLNCLSEGSLKPCGVCDSCRAIDSSSHMDVVELDAASYRGIDEIRKIRDAVSYRPVMGRFKVYIIDEFHMLTREAFNALLKTLEEPPERVVFVLATTNLEKVPETVLSRCQIFNFKPLDEKDIMTYLEKIAKAEGLEFDERALRYISKAAHGGMRDAVNLMERVIAFADDVSEESVRTTLGILPEEVVKEFISAFSSGDPSRILKMSEDIQSGGFTYEVFLEQVIDEVKDQLIRETSGESFNLLSSLWEINRELRYAEDKRGTFEVMTLLKSGLGRVRINLTTSDEPASTDSIAVKADSKKSEDSDMVDGKELTEILEHLRRNSYILLWTLLSLAKVRHTKEGEDFVIDTDSDYSQVLLEERLESLNQISTDLVGKKFFLADDSVREDPFGNLDKDSREYVDAVIAGLGLKDDIDKGKIKIELEEE
ncbi:MAG: DNA polymerase III subunit gamma/tau, partial [Thermotogaceae bacterium]|nr:DNA polymerase III subunit gamma/tau [Thermotogaceae bacterium]